MALIYIEDLGNKFIVTHFQYIILVHMENVHNVVTTQNAAFLSPASFE